MSDKFYRSKRFLDLQKQWYDKLSQSGFSDLEHYSQKTGLLEHSPFLRTSLSKFKQLQHENVHAKLEYFSSAVDFLNDHDFPTMLHELLWRLYIKGTTQRDMIAIILENRFKPVSTFWISTELTKLKKAFAAWQATQPDKPETLEEFMQSNNAIDWRHSL